MKFQGKDVATSQLQQLEIIAEGRKTIFKNAEYLFFSFECWDPTAVVGEKQTFQIILTEEQRWKKPAKAHDKEAERERVGH